MSDDPRNVSDSGGFDDWLSEAPSKASDPYAELSIDEVGDDTDAPTVDPEPGESQVIENSQDAADTDASAPEPDPESVESPDEDDLSGSDDGTADVPTVAAADDQAQDVEDDTGEIPLVEDDPPDQDESAVEPDGWHAEPMVEFEAFDGDDEADTGEVEIVAPTASGVVDAGEHEATLMYDGGSDSDGLASREVAAATAEADSDEREDEDVTSDVPAVAWFPESTDTDEEASDDDSPVDLGDLAAAATISAGVESSSESDDFDPFEDTGEAVFVSGEMPGVGVPATGFGDLWDQDADGNRPVEDESSSEDLEDFTLDQEDLLSGATQEHIGLAAAIAAAETEDTEQVALVAEIPGLETSVVGFEDVVEAEGHRRVRARASGDLVARIVTGIILVVALGASLIWRPALMVFAIAVFVLGAGEFYTALVRTERKPIALFGFIGIVGASLGAYFWSAVAIPISFILATILLLLFYAVVPGKSDPMGNLALTATVMVWAGLGSFAMLIARSDDYQVLIVGVVVSVAAADIAAFFVGRSLGRTHFAPWVSPKKTVEGLVAGVFVALGVGAALHFFPPFELTSGLAIGAAAAFLTPIGDLAMSAAKRALGLKDMGSVLPGHGGFLDRIDGLLFVIPVAWAVFVWAGLV